MRIAGPLPPRGEVVPERRGEVKGYWGGGIWFAWVGVRKEKSELLVGGQLEWRRLWREELRLRLLCLGGEGEGLEEI